MNPLIPSLGVVTFFIIVVGILVTNGRKNLTPDQLYALEKFQNISINNFLPALPVVLCLFTAKFIPQYRSIQVVCAIGLSLLWITYNAWVKKNKMLSENIPRHTAMAYFYGSIILAFGIALSIAIIFPRISWE